MTVFRDDDCGICSKCGDHTPVQEPCCNAPVWFEGHPVTAAEGEE